MRTRPKRASAVCRGSTMLECLMYILLLVIVMGVATGIFYQAWDDSKALRRNADDIIRALHAGDQWRSDIRTANGPLQMTDADGFEQLHIPSAKGIVVYSFDRGELRRQEHVLLSNVKVSHMQSEARHNVLVWRWELELKTVKKSAQFRPLFTFETVAGGGVIQ